jgi:hypothetical protein
MKNVVIEKHKRLKRNVEITTIYKKSKTPMSFQNIQLFAQNLQQLHPNKKLMIKGLCSQGFLQMKAYDSPLDPCVMSGGARDNVGDLYIYKASFYLL